MAFGEHVLNDSNRDLGFQFQKKLVSAMVVTFLMLFILSALQVIKSKQCLVLI